MNYNEVDGDLIELALAGEFDVIAHGVNCFCTQKSGLAPQMVKAFGTDRHFELEGQHFKGDINKLGQIESCRYFKTDQGKVLADSQMYNTEEPTFMYVVNAYTQYRYGKNHEDGEENPLDYQALLLCLRKMNHEFKGKHIGLPKIGAGLAGGNWETIKMFIQVELKDCKVTVVKLLK